MVYFDRNAFDDANKGLSICFIITITITNCILIYKQFKKGNLLYTPRGLILTSLAFGDIFLALFALVFLARLVFEQDFTYDCSTYKAYISYVYFLIHFVYGVGLAVLAGEFLQRHRTPQPTGNSSSSLVKSIVYSACPWILGLIIILPLTMANAYEGPYDFCQMVVTRSKRIAMYVVSVILPAFLAVLVCIAVMFIKLSPPLQSSSPAAVTYQGRTQGVIINSQNTNVGNAADPPPYPGSHAAAALYSHNTSIPGPQLYLSNGQSGSSQILMTLPNDKPVHNHGGQIFSTNSGQYAVQLHPLQQYPVQHPPPQFPAQQYPVQHPQPQFPAQQYTTQNNVIFTAPTNVIYQRNTTAPTNPVKEKTALLVAAIVYFLCVIPQASLATYYNPYVAVIITDDSYKYLIIKISLFWLSIARSLITPIIFIIVN
ncbi:hypothetical protein BsWGS_16235 [Bradybaena similaris]